jgi:hypothetical protein
MHGRNSLTSLPELARPSLNNERARGELKSLMPEDAEQAIGHGVRAKRSKSGAVTVELL